MNGIYYAQSSPNAPPFVTEGDEVEDGQVVALIEAMKVFNEIVAPYDGRVTRIVAANNQLVQAGDPLLYLLPAS
jgi:acetyl-CoA carboxylase biotin carboxyl carrier protein